MQDDALLTCRQRRPGLGHSKVEASMTLNRRRLLAAGLVAVATGGVSSASAGDAADYEAGLDAAFAETGPAALAGGVVTREGPVWSGGRGVRRIGGTDPPNPEGPRDLG